MPLNKQIQRSIIKTVSDLDIPRYEHEVLLPLLEASIICTKRLHVKVTPLIVIGCNTWCLKKSASNSYTPDTSRYGT